MWKKPCYYTLTVLLMLVAAGARAQSIFWINGNGCVNQQQRFVFSGSGTVSSWSITGSYTGVTQTNPFLYVTWVAAGSVSVTCNYVNTAGQHLSTPPYPVTINSTSSPSVSISANPASVCQGSTVTFTANAVNAGASPSYTWYQAGSQVGSNSATYATSGISNGQQVYCTINSSNQCASPTTATSNTVTETVNPFTTITATVAQTGIACTGQSASFQCTPNASSSPPAGYTFQWYRNGSPVTGITGPPPYVLVLNNGSVNSGDQIYCKVSTTSPCYTGSVSSNTVSTTFSAAQTFYPSIAVPAIYLCQGQSITFTGSGNFAPTSYQWTSSGNPIAGATGSTYTVTVSSLAQLQAIGINETTSATGCLSNTSGSTSLASVPFTVNPTVTPSVSISANPAGTACLGSTVTFTANPVNGGSPPGYQWYLNNNTTGSNSATYSNSSLNNGDQVYCKMTTSAACPTTTQATSGTITETVTPSVTNLSVTVAQSGLPCLNQGGTPVFFATTTPITPSGATFQWYDNGAPINNTAPSSSAPAYVCTNPVVRIGDPVYCTMNANTACWTPGSASSNTVYAAAQQPQSFNVGVGPLGSGIDICIGHQITLQCNSSPAALPGSYQWTVNNSPVPNYTSSTLTLTIQSLAQISNIQVSAQAGGGCVSNTSATATTAILPWYVLPFQVPSVTISESSVITGGQPQFTFTANPTNGGSQPGYTWTLNGATVGTGPTYNAGTLTQGKANTILVQMTTSPEICVAPDVVCQSINFVW